MLPSLCRIALENAFLEAAWIRHHRAGGPEHALQAAVTGADKLMKVAALALFGDARRTGDVYRELRTRCGQHAVDTLKRCQDGAHAEGARITDPHRFVDLVDTMAQKIRKPEEAVR
ncbi:hypothetical protein [Streptomyces sodiiphilus]|uniref:hypothetical protein n=1 Tax=Streptomyces sodiiphilus TaxID=226217 RepID=UPI0031DC4A65